MSEKKNAEQVQTVDDAMTERETVKAILDSVKVEDRHPTLFIVPPDTPFIELSDGEVYPLRSRRVECWLTEKLWGDSAEAALPTKRAVEQVFNLLEARAWAEQVPEATLPETSVVEAVLAGVEKQGGELVGSSTGLFIYLKNRVAPELLEHFPPTPAAFGRELTRLVPTFRKAGFQLEQFRTRRSRCWWVRRVMGDISAAESSPGEILSNPVPSKEERRGDGSNGNAQPSLPDARDPATIEMLAEVLRHKLEEIVKGGRP